MKTRPASHAGSWYEDRPSTLASELDGWLARVPEALDGSDLPIPDARAIIAPHAGYSYSGPCAAWAYKALDLSQAKRVFVLGPSHTYYLRGCGLTTFAKYSTPFGDLTVDQPVTKQLAETGLFSSIPPHRDVQEHSLEMHLPYLWRRLEQTLGGSEGFPTIIPILVGDLSEKEEASFGLLLAPYLQDVHNAFIVSSDFCHWGDRFSYRPQYRTDGVLWNPDERYESDGSADEPGVLKMEPNPMVKPDTPIHEYIKLLDDMAKGAIETGDHSQYFGLLKKTKNTVCGRHPIGVLMAAMATLANKGLEEGKGRFKFVKYDRSSLVIDPVTDSSVSYASAYAVV